MGKPVAVSRSCSFWPNSSRNASGVKSTRLGCQSLVEEREEFKAGERLGSKTRENLVALSQQNRSPLKSLKALKSSHTQHLLTPLG